MPTGQCPSSGKARFAGWLINRPTVERGMRAVRGFKEPVAAASINSSHCLQNISKSIYIGGGTTGAFYARISPGRLRFKAALALELVGWEEGAGDTDGWCLFFNLRCFLIDGFIMPLLTRCIWILDFICVFIVCHAERVFAIRQLINLGNN